MYSGEMYLTFLILVSYFNIFNIYFWDEALNFNQPLLQSVSHDSSEIILIWFIISVESVCAVQYFLEPVVIFSLIIWWIKSLKEKHLFKIESLLLLSI